MKTYRKVISAAITLLMLVSLGCSAGAESTRIGVIFTVAGLGGSSFNDVIFNGIKRAQEELGIDFDSVEPKSISDEQIVMDEMAASEEYALIIGVGNEMKDALTAVATDYPEQKFCFIDASVDLPNIANYASKEQEGAFLCGALAALAEQSKLSPMFNDQKIFGFIGGVDNPIIRRFLAGFEAGAKYIDPEYEVLYDYVGGFNDPGTGKTIGATLNQKGADLIFHAAGASGIGMFQAAEENKFLAIGVNLNQNSLYPDYIIASMLKRVDNAAYHAISTVLDNTFAGGTVTLSLADGGVGYTNEGSNIALTAEIKAKLDEIETAIKDGKLVVPATLEEIDPFIQNLPN